MVISRSSIGVVSVPSVGEVVIISAILISITSIFGLIYVFIVLPPDYEFSSTKILYAAADSQYFANRATRFISSASSLCSASVVTNV